MDHGIPFQDPGVFFDAKIFTDINETLCLSEKDDIFEWKIFHNYTALILQDKYEQIDTAKVAADQKQLY